MVPEILLDTEVCIQPLMPEPRVTVEERWRQLADEQLAVSAACVAELKASLLARNSKRLWSLYEELLHDRITVLPFDAAAADYMAKILQEDSRNSFPRASLDCMVAATAQSHGLILATTRPSAYAGISGLAVEDWSTPAQSLVSG